MSDTSNVTSRVPERQTSVAPQARGSARKCGPVDQPSSPSGPPGGAVASCASALGQSTTDFVGSSGSKITRILGAASGGSPGASAEMTGSFFVGVKISWRPSATPVANPPMADRRRQPSKRLGDALSPSNASSASSSGSWGFGDRCPSLSSCPGSRSVGSTASLGSMSP